MKVLQFTVPVARHDSIHVQEDVLPHFYEHFHRHKEVQIVCIKEGKGTIVAGNDMHHFTNGNIFVLDANLPHVFKSDEMYFNARKKLKVQALHIFFDPAGFIAPVLELPEMQGVKRFLASAKNGLKLGRQHEKQLSEQMLIVQQNTEGGRIAAFIELLQQMADCDSWIKLSEAVGDNDFSETEGLRMNNVYQYILKNFTEEISLEKIAGIACLTPQSFCRYFKKHTLKTYTYFINELRVSEACKRITSGNYESISSLAYDLGFNSVVTFNRVFKAIRGQSPREYLRLYESKTHTRQ